MEKEAFEEYLNERYYKEIKWYDDKAQNNQKKYKIFQTVIIVFSVLVPILLYVDNVLLQLLAIISSLIVGVSTSLSKIFKYQENWINYRTICETLKKEIHFYHGKLHAYSNTEDLEALFIDRVESLISRENTLWVVCHKPQQ